jgi:Tol biopolymer transport system component
MYDIYNFMIIIISSSSSIVPHWSETTSQLLMSVCRNVSNGNVHLYASVTSFSYSL